MTLCTLVERTKEDFVVRDVVSTERRRRFFFDRIFASWLVLHQYKFK
jgi:hypothetical protein